MSITTALDTALSGINLAQNGLNLVAQNIASANVPGYTAKTLNPTDIVAGGALVGIDSSSVTRQIDTLLQSQLRTETSSGQLTSVVSNFQNQLDSLYGPPGSDSALDTIFNNFTSSLQDLVSTPESPETQSEVLQNAQALTNRINGISTQIQTMRTQAEQGIASDVTQANTLLSQLQTVNQQIVSESNGTNQPVDLLDQRDQILNNLSQLMDIKVTTNPDNSVTVNTRSGALLFDKVASTLSFDARSNLTAQDVYSTDPSQRGVGTITLTAPGGGTTDLIADNGIKSGSIGAYISLRDNVLVQAQSNLDEFASSMSLALSTQTQNSTPVTAAGGLSGQQIDVSDLNPGDSITVNVTSGSVPRTVTFVNVDDPSQPISASQVAGTTGEVHGVDFSNPAGAVASIQSILGPGFTVTNPSGTLINIMTSGSSGNSVTALSASVTATTTNGGQAALPLFTDGSSIYSASVNNGTEKTGFSSRIAVNPALLSDPTGLVIMGSGTDPGDPTRPQAILNNLTSAQVNFAPSAGLNAGPEQSTVTSYLQQLINTVGQNAASAQQANDGQTTIVNGLQDRFNQTSKVNVDNEMTNLIQLQETYEASARVMSTANTMLTDLFQSVPATLG